MKNFILLFFWCLVPIVILGQTGGETTFPFLDLPYNARVGAMGRNYISFRDKDVNLAVNNPSLLYHEMHNSISFNQGLHAGGINHGMLTYARKLNSENDLMGSTHLRYVSYGKMDRTSPTGEVIGTFSAGDFILGAGLAKQLNPRISVGGNLNLIWSQLESFSSLGVSLDVAGTYFDKSERTTITALVRNAGVQLKRYTDTDRIPLPVNPMVSISHRLKHAPFLFSVVVHNLNRWDLTYTDPNAEPTTNLLGEEVPVPVPGFGEKLARHFIFQMEVLGGDVMRIRLAFDYQRRREFLVENRPGMAGFSTGVGFNFKRFSIDYGLVIYSSAGFNNLISLTTNMDKWKRAR